MYTHTHTVRRYTICLSFTDTFQQGLSLVARNNAAILGSQAPLLEHAKKMATQAVPLNPSVKEPISPFQNKTNAVEYALARLDDLLNWGRKGIPSVNYMLCDSC